MEDIKKTIELLEKIIRDNRKDMASHHKTRQDRRDLDRAVQVLREMSR